MKVSVRRVCLFSPPRLLWSPVSFWLTKATTSNYNSNPSNSLVINKAHIVAEGGKGEGEGAGGRGGTFTVMVEKRKERKGCEAYFSKS